LVYSTDGRQSHRASIGKLMAFPLWAVVTFATLHSFRPDMAALLAAIGSPPIRCPSFVESTVLARRTTPNKSVQ
jgi:hypothetical protein